MLFKLHNLSVSDTLGFLAMLLLALWNTLLGYGLTYCSTGSSGADR